MLAATIFFAAGFVNAVYAKKFDDIAIVPTFVLTPLTYLGGVFYYGAQLPSRGRRSRMLNPILYMVNAFRYGVLGVNEINLAWAYAVMLAFVVVLGAFCLTLLNRGVGLRS